MRAMTIRDIPEELERTIRRKATDQKLSLNKTVIQILEEALGQKKSVRKVYHDLDHLFGRWTTKEAAQFDKHVASMRPIDKDMWK